MIKLRTILFAGGYLIFAMVLHTMMLRIEIPMSEKVTFIIIFIILGVLGLIAVNGGDEK